MKKLFILIILVVSANNSFAIETLETEFLDIVSWVYGSLLAIVGLFGVFMASKQIFAGQIDVKEILQIIGVTVALLLILMITKEFIIPNIMSSAKSLSQQIVVEEPNKQATSNVDVEEPNKQQYLVKEKSNNFIYYIIFILFGVYYLKPKKKYKKTMY